MELLEEVKKITNSIQTRKIRGMLGLDYSTISILSDYLKSLYGDRISERDLLWTLYFLRVYPTNDEASSVLRIQAKKFRDVVKTTIYLLESSLNEVCNLFIVFQYSNQLIGKVG
jgi:hypothetical protein